MFVICVVFGCLVVIGVEIGNWEGIEVGFVMVCVDGDDVESWFDVV